MADLDALLAEFEAAFEAGERPDVAGILERASPEQRQELSARIDSYLMTAPRTAWDPVAYESSPVRESVERVWESMEGVSGTWPELLPQLRHRARIRRAELVRKLAVKLGVGGREDRVAAYYNDMEHGRLPPEGVSGRVFAALGEILGESAERIRNAGFGLPPPTESETVDLAFARLAAPDEDYASEPAEAPAGVPAAEAGRDEVDELFRGGG